MCGWSSSPLTQGTEHIQERGVGGVRGHAQVRGKSRGSHRKMAEEARNASPVPPHPQKMGMLRICPLLVL